MLTQLLPLAKEKSSPRLANSAALHVSPTPRAQERKDPRKSKKEKKQDKEGGRKAEGGTEGGTEGGRERITDPKPTLPLILLSTHLFFDEFVHLRVIHRRRRRRRVAGGEVVSGRVLGARP